MATPLPTLHSPECRKQKYSSSGKANCTPSTSLVASRPVLRTDAANSHPTSKSRRSSISGATYAADSGLGGGKRKDWRVLEGAADDPQLGNPLLRMHRLGTGWFGVIFEYEGVLVRNTVEEHNRAWLELCKREGKPTPPRWQLDRLEGMKNEQVISEVLCLARNPSVVKRLADEKEEIFRSLQKNSRPSSPLPGVLQLLQTLRKHEIPIAVASTARRDRLVDGLTGAGLLPLVDAIISGDDVSRGRPDPEPYLYAAQAIERPPLRCVVIGSANASIEAAHDAEMQCVALASHKPIFELSSADLVTRRLEDLSIQNLKQLFRMEEGVEPQVQLEPEIDSTTLTALSLYDDDRYLN